jgi:hypothetical protein
MVLPESIIEDECFDYSFLLYIKTRCEFALSLAIVRIDGASQSFF